MKPSTAVATAANSPTATQVMPVALVTPPTGDLPISPSRYPAVPILLEDSGFTPSGFMGDATADGAVLIDLHSQDRCYSSPDCQKWTDLPSRGHNGWAA